MSKPIYHLTITPEGDQQRWPAPPERRLARVLKGLLRAYGFRCIDARQENAPPAVQTAQAASHDEPQTQPPVRANPL
jgi:hypothetical protein